MSPMLRLLSLATLTSALLACDVLTAVRGCGDIPLDSSVVAPVQAPSAAPIGADERERRAWEVMAARFGLPIEDVLIHEQMTQANPGGTIYTFKLYVLRAVHNPPVFLN